MKKLSLATLAIAVAAALTTAALGNDNEAQVLDQISGYRQWTKVNEDPVKLEVPKTGTDVNLSIAEAPA